MTASGDEDTSLATCELRQRNGCQRCSLVSSKSQGKHISKVVNGNMLFFFRSVFSLPFSTDPGGNRSWCFRAIDITIQVSRDPALQVAVEEALEGATSVLRGLEFGPLSLNSRARLCAELERHPISTPLPTLPARPCPVVVL